MNLSPRNKFILIAAVAGVVVIGAAVGLIMPQLSKISALDGRIQTVTSEKQSAETLYASRLAVKKRAAVTDANLLQIGSAMPEDPHVPDLILEIQDTAFQSNVCISAVKFSGVEDLATYQAVPVDVDIYGTWADTVDFIQRLEKRQRLLRLIDVNCQVISDEPVENVDITFPPYYQIHTVIKFNAFAMPPAKAGSTSTATAAPPAAPAQ